MTIDEEALEDAADAIDNIACIIDEGGEDDGISNARECAQAAVTAYLTALEAKGYVIVPSEPTEGMVLAGIDAAPMTLIERQPANKRRRESWDTDECAEVYRAMLAARGE